MVYIASQTIKEKWYNFIPVKFEMLKQLQDKELCLIGQDKRDKKLFLRFIVCHNIEMFNWIYDRLHLSKSERNLYHSVAIINKQVPILPFDLKKRRKSDEYKEFNENYEKYIIGYDYFTDFDGKEDFKACHDEAKIFKQILDSYEIPYYVLNSSKKGFHFVIPSEYFDIPIKERTQIFFDISNNIKAIYELKSMDISIFDLKRVKKLPYSYVHDGSIALPLNDQQFEFFTGETADPEKIFKNILIKDRGLLTRKYDKSKPELKENVKRFIEDFK